jgi:hypothetical protein
VLRLRPDVEWRDIDGEVVVLDLDTSEYLAVNHSGAVLWPLVAAGATEGDLAEALRAHYDVDGGRARADVSEFVVRLRALGLVEEPE